MVAVAQIYSDSLSPSTSTSSFVVLFVLLILKFIKLNHNWVVNRLRLREMMRRSLRAAGLGRHESGPSSSDHQDPVSPPIAPPSWVPDPPPMDPGEFMLKLQCSLNIVIVNGPPKGDLWSEF